MLIGTSQEANEDLTNTRNFGSWIYILRKTAKFVDFIFAYRCTYHLFYAKLSRLCINLGMGLSVVQNSIASRFIRVQRGSVRVQRGSDGSALAWCKAGPSSNLGSAPQGGSAHWACSYEDMEKGLNECYEWMIVWMYMYCNRFISLESDVEICWVSPHFRWLLKNAKTTFCAHNSFCFLVSSGRFTSLASAESNR